MGQRVVEGKKDADKDRAELIAELNALRGLNSRLKDVVKRYENVAGKRDIYRSRYDLDARTESVESLRDELREKQREVDLQSEELGVQNVELRVQLDEINARVNEVARMNAALRESEDKFRVLADTSSAVIYVYQGESLVYVNDAAERVTGYSKAELLKMKFWDIVHPDFRELIRERGIARQHGEQVPSPYEFKLITKTGDTRWAELTAGRFQYMGKPAGVATFFDITERKRAEEALRESEASLARSQAIAHLSNWEVDVRTNMVHGSDELYRMFNLGPDIALDAYIEKFHPDDRPGVVESIKAAIYEGKLYNIDYRIVPRPGEVHYVHAEGEVTRDEKGDPLRFFGTILDITERKLAEEELRKVREELERRVRERTSELEKANVELEDQVRERQRSEMALRASEKDLHRANRALKALSKCKEAMIRAEDEAALLDDICHIVVDIGGYRMVWIGYVEDDELRTVRPVARAGYDEGYVDNLKIALNHPVYGNGPTGISLKSGRPYGSRNVQTDDNMQPWRTEALKRGYLSTLNLPLMYEGQILGTLVIYADRPGVFDDEGQGMLRDLADNLAYGIRSIRNRALRDRAEKELLRAKEELEVRVEERTEELNSAKAQAELYVDLMGHDINNLNQVALISLELLHKMVEDDKLSELVAKPLNAITSSSYLIENVRKLQKLKSGELQTEVVDLNGILAGLKAQYSRVSEKDVTISFDPGNECKVMANGLIKDVFANLIWNAIKHSDGTAVEINLRITAYQQDDGIYYRVAVEDNGPGVPDDLKAKIFARFQRGDTKASGKGLGLYIVRTLVESYHGKVWVEDRIAGDHTKGSRFVVMLPAAE